MGLFYVCFKFDLPCFGLCAAGDIRIAGNRDSGQIKEGKQVMANMSQERAFQSQVAGLAGPFTPVWLPYRIPENVPSCSINDLKQVKCLK